MAEDGTENEENDREGSPDGPDPEDAGTGEETGTGTPWERTTEQLRALAEEFREGGWNVVDVAAADTTPERPGGRTGDRFGLTHVVPGNRADAVRDAFRPEGFERYETYRRRVGTTAFQVTALFDADRGVAILVAGAYDLADADGMIEAAREEGVLYTHLRTLDGTHLGSFRHDDPAQLVPEVDDRGGDEGGGGIDDGERHE